jgi:hypothetical protein
MGDDLDLYRTFVQMDPPWIHHVMSVGALPPLGSSLRDQQDI